MFLLKKIVSHLIYPIPILTILGIVILILIVLKRKDKLVRILTTAMIVFLGLCSFKPIPHMLTKSLERKNSALLETPSEVTTVVVLGGGSCSDNSLPLTSQLSSASLIRLIEGITHLNRLDSARLIVTGGAIYDTVTIASFQRKMAMQLGVDSTLIAMADSALDTEMEAAAVRKMVQEDRIILVTSATHMTRAAALFRKVGFDPIPAPTSHRTHNNAAISPYTLFPSTGNIDNLTKSLHEHLGITWSRIRGKI